MIAIRVFRVLVIFVPVRGDAARPPPLPRPVWIRAVAILAILGFASFTGLAFSTARPGDIANALSPFRALLTR